MQPTDQQLKNRVEWDAALRSRKFSQGNGSLVDVNTKGKQEYCCLGVACSVSDLKQSTNGEEGFVFERSKGFTPIILNSVPDRYWFSKQYGLTLYQSDELIELCTNLNDDLGKTFGQIANQVATTFKQYDKINR